MSYQWDALAAMFGQLGIAAKQLNDYPAAEVDVGTCSNTAVPERPAVYPDEHGPLIISE